MNSAASQPATPEFKALFKQALDLNHVERFTEAAAVLEKLLAMNPNSASAHALLANTLWDLGRLTEAVSFFQKAVELAPTSETASLGLFHTLLEAGDKQRTLAEMERFLSVSASDEYESIAQRLGLLGQKHPKGAIHKETQIQPTVIALRGKQDSGKTTALDLAFLELSEGGENERRSGKHSDKSEDRRGGLLEINGKKAGFITAGDDVEILKRWFKKLFGEDCIVIVCATLATGSTVDFVEGLKPDCSVEWIEKERNEAADRDRGNREIADEIVKKVREAIKRA